jgi:hypothetical protein
VDALKERLLLSGAEYPIDQGINHSLFLKIVSLQDLEETGLVLVTVWISIADAIV